MLATFLAQQPTQLPQVSADVGAKWLTVAMLVIAICFLNWKKWTKSEKLPPLSHIFSVALGTGAFGIFLEVLNIEWINSVAGDVAGWFKVQPDSPLTPFIFLAASVGVRVAQIFQGADGPIKRILDFIPDPIEVILIVILSGIGGLAMAGSPVWMELFTAAGTVVLDIFNVAKIAIVDLLLGAITKTG